MKHSLFALVASFAFVSCGDVDRSEVALAQNLYPSGPAQELTPGSLCQKKGHPRHSERINYCPRSVSKATKIDVIRSYDENLGYQIRQMRRQDFKIDHLIPLCIGGSNETENLWPQHKSIFVHTDIIEQRLCDLMIAGKMLQAEAIGLIREVKADTSKAEAMRRDLEARL